MFAVYCNSDCEIVAKLKFGVEKKLVDFSYKKRYLEPVTYDA
jgi:hypothetical protein